MLTGNMDKMKKREVWAVEFEQCLGLVKIEIDDSNVRGGVSLGLF